MPAVTIENPIINSPFEQPRRHFRFTEDGITDEVVEGRRISEYFVPIPRARKKSPKQMSFETEWTADRLQENQFINQVRERVAIWRKGGRWMFIEIVDPWDAMNTIRAFLKGEIVDGAAPMFQEP